MRKDILLIQKNHGIAVKEIALSCLHDNCLQIDTYFCAKLLRNCSSCRNHELALQKPTILINPIWKEIFRLHLLYSQLRTSLFSIEEKKECSVDTRREVSQVLGNSKTSQKFSLFKNRCTLSRHSKSLHLEMQIQCTVLVIISSVPNCSLDSRAIHQHMRCIAWLSAFSSATTYWTSLSVSKCA